MMGRGERQLACNGLLQLASTYLIPIWKDHDLKSPECTVKLPIYVHSDLMLEWPRIRLHNAKKWLMGVQKNLDPPCSGEQIALNYHKSLTVSCPLLTLMSEREAINSFTWFSGLWKGSLFAIQAQILSVVLIKLLSSSLCRLINNLAEKKVHNFQQGKKKVHYCQQILVAASA